jgi:uncharacterized protein
MRRRERVVVDTNVLVSRLLVQGSVAGRAVDQAAERGRFLVSEATMTELVAVLGRAKLDPYVSLADREQFIRLLGRIAELVPILRAVRACRDPKDDMFLEVAVNGGAELIVTGDRDLLDLHPFLGIPILSPGDYLRRG